MNKSIAFLLVIAISCVSYSQGIYGVAGVTFSKIKGDAVADNVSISNKIGPRLGLYTDFSFKGKLYMQVGMEYCSKGYKASDPDYSNLVTMEYIQFPVNLLVKVPVDAGKKLQFMAGAGGYLGFGVSSKMKLSPRDSNSMEEGSVNSGSFDDFGMRIIDLGLNTLAGVEIAETVQITFNYQHGLQTIFYSSEFGLVRNRMMSLLVGYSF